MGHLDEQQNGVNYQQNIQHTSSLTGAGTRVVGRTALSLPPIHFATFGAGEVWRMSGLVAMIPARVDM